jgi:hypothetical protein
LSSFVPRKNRGFCGAKGDNRDLRMDTVIAPPCFLVV